MVDKRSFGSRQASLPDARPDRGQQEPAQSACRRNCSQQQQPSNAQRSEQQQPSDVQRSNLNPAAHAWQQSASSADTFTSESGAAASAAVNTEARRRKRGCRGNGALQRRRQQRTQEWRDLERNSRYESLRGQPMRERPGPRVRPRGRAPLGKVWHTWDGWVDATEVAPPPGGTGQRAGTRRSSSVEPLRGMEGVMEAIKTQTDVIAALAAAVEKMSRAVSNFVFAQRGSRKGSENQGQSEVREEREKKKAEKKKDAEVTNVAAAESAGAEAEDAEAVTAENMAEVAEGRKNAEKKEEREKERRKKAEKKTETEGNMSAEVGAAVMTATSEAETSDADAGDAAESTVWTCIGDFSGNSSRWQEDASETAAIIAEAVVKHRMGDSGLLRDDLLCSVMEDAVEEMPVAEVVNYTPEVAAAVAAMAVLAMAMMAVTTNVSEAKEAAAAAVGQQRQ